ncbi:MAG: hypothetical protein JSV04_06230 [Candidatus Heimdallarchaeota archaeon]|nr:MAG: hypothetical protein JSV04_06230 [Candidatus Heimdallarchaeota archaeon]
MNNFVIRRLETTPPQNIVVILTGIAAITSIIIFLLMRPVEAALKATSPYGVMELEFAWTVDQINRIFDSWGSDLIVQELNVTLIDYGFLVAYSTFLAGVTLLISRKYLTEQKQQVGFYMTLVPFIAALFDAIENLNLVLMLTAPTSYPMFSPFLASLFATLKFSLIIIVIISWIGIALWLLYRRVSSQDI